VPLTHGVALSEIRDHVLDPALWRWVFRNSGNEIPAPDAEWIIGQLEERPSLASDADEPSLEDGNGEEPERPHLRLQAKLLGARPGNGS
jgi:hypothetical protein